MEQEPIGDQYFEKIFLAAKDTKDGITISRLKELLGSNGEVEEDDYQNLLPTQEPTIVLSKANFIELMTKLNEGYAVFGSGTLGLRNFKLFQEIEIDPAKNFTHEVLTKIESLGFLDITRKEVKLIDKYIAEKLPRNDQNVYDPKALGPADFKNTTNIKMICHKELWNMFCMKGMATIEGSSP